MLSTLSCLAYYIRPCIGISNLSVRRKITKITFFSTFTNVFLNFCHVFYVFLTFFKFFFGGRTFFYPWCIGLRADAKGERATSRREEQSSRDADATRGRDASSRRRLRPPQDDHARRRTGLVPSPFVHRHLAAPRTCSVS